MLAPILANRYPVCNTKVGNMNTNSLSDNDATLSNLLVTLGLASENEARQTAARFTELLRSFTPVPPPKLSVFPLQTSGVVSIEEIPFYSLCSHHLVPFFGHVTVRYLPKQRVAGLGGVAKTITAFAHRPQLQEIMAEQVADYLFTHLEPIGLTVTVNARQLCLELRNQAHGAAVVVAAQRGDCALL